MDKLSIYLNLFILFKINLYFKIEINIIIKKKKYQFWFIYKILFKLEKSTKKLIKYKIINIIILYKILLIS